MCNVNSTFKIETEKENQFSLKHTSINFPCGKQIDI